MAANTENSFTHLYEMTIYMYYDYMLTIYTVIMYMSAYSHIYLYTHIYMYIRLIHTYIYIYLMTERRQTKIKALHTHSIISSPSVLAFAPSFCHLLTDEKLQH